MDVLDAVLPLVSVLIGSGIAYWLNVRTRQRSKVEDVFHDAIAAVGVAVASLDYISDMRPWPAATDADHDSVVSQLARDAHINHARAVAEARAALARASAYELALREYYKANTAAVYERADEIMDLLRRKIGAL